MRSAHARPLLILVHLLVPSIALCPWTCECSIGHRRSINQAHSRPILQHPRNLKFSAGNLLRSISSDETEEYPTGDNEEKADKEEKLVAAATQFGKERFQTGRSFAKRKWKSFDKKNPSPKAKMKAAWKKVRSGPKWVYPGISFAIGYGLGANRRRQQHPSGLDVADTSSNRKAPYLSQLALCFFVGREVWRNVPDWVKRQLPIVKRRYRKTQATLEPSSPSAATDLSSFPVITQKLQSLFKASAEISPMTSTEIRTSFLSFLQLNGQLKSQRPYKRDKMYEESGTPLTSKERASRCGLEEALELADIAYDELPFAQTIGEALLARNFTLVRHDPLVLPGSAAHYIAMSSERKLIVIGVKGSSRLEDFITDVCGSVVQHELEFPFVVGGKCEMRCHEGVFSAARQLYDEVVTLIEEFILPTNYDILLTGHSLGAGVACLLGILLRSRFAELRSEPSRLQVIAIAPPPVLDLISSKDCSSFTTSVVNNADIVPRMSRSNLLITTKFLEAVNDKLAMRGLRPETFESTAAYIKKVAEGADGSMIMPPREIRDTWKNLVDKSGVDDPGHLFVPGSVLHMYDMWSKPDYGAKKNKTDDLADDGLPLSPLMHPVERVHVTNCTAFVLRTLEIDGRMLADHSCASYRSSIRTLFGNQTGV